MSLRSRIDSLLGRLHDRAVRHGWRGAAKRAKKAEADLKGPAPIHKKVTRWPGVAAARAQSENGPAFGEGMCLFAVQTAYGIEGLPGEVNAPDAITAWQRATKKHPTGTVLSVPRGYPVFWSGGSQGHGHIAISAGGGYCWSTDIRRTGMFDHVRISQIHDQWGLTLLGWTEDLEGVPVPAKEES